MNPRETRQQETPGPETTVGELLILPDGRVLAHNLSAALAGVLAELNPGDLAMNQRAAEKKPFTNELPN